MLMCESLCAHALIHVCVCVCVYLYVSKLLCYVFVVCQDLEVGRKCEWMRPPFV